MIKPIMDMISGATKRISQPGRTRRCGAGFDRVDSMRVLEPLPAPTACPACNLNEVTDEALLLVAPLANGGARIYCRLDDDELEIVWDRKDLSCMICQILFAFTHLNVQLHAKHPPKAVNVTSGRMIANPSAVYLEIAHDGPTLRSSVLRLVNLCEGSEDIDYETPGIELLAVKLTLLKGGGTLLVQSPCPESLYGVRYRLVFARGRLTEAKKAAGA